ncbi:MAG: response regulator [Acidobacteria bacterium]|nr:response regulator [Acidobacteriota bacterium]
MIPTAESPKRHSEPILGGGRRVLVVDDEEGVRTLVREALELWEFQVQEASSGEAALSLLASLPFDLVVTDLRMPGLDGPGLYEQAGALCATVPPFVFVTGDAASQEMRRFLDGVRSPVLVKPFTLMSLREAIESALLAQQLKSTLVEASSAQSVP